MRSQTPPTESQRSIFRSAGQLGRPFGIRNVRIQRRSTEALAWPHRVYRGQTANHNVAVEILDQSRHKNVRHHEVASLCVVVHLQGRTFDQAGVDRVKLATQQPRRVFSSGFRLVVVGRGDPLECFLAAQSFRLHVAHLLPQRPTIRFHSGLCSSHVDAAGRHRTTKGFLLLCQVIAPLAFSLDLGDGGIVLVNLRLPCVALTLFISGEFTPFFLGAVEKIAIGFNRLALLLQNFVEIHVSAPCGRRNTKAPAA